MSQGYRVRIEGGEDLQKLFARFPEITAKHMKKAVTQSVIAIEQAAKPEAPHFMGRLRSSITFEVHVTDKNVIGKVGPAMGREIYPLVMEFGRRKGAKPPPPAALIRWVQLKINPPEDQLWGIARRISWAISRKGIVGREYMKKGVEKSQDKILRYFVEGLDRIMQDLDKG